MMGEECSTLASSHCTVFKLSLPELALGVRVVGSPYFGKQMAK